MTESDQAPCPCACIRRCPCGSACLRCDAAAASASSAVGCAAGDTNEAVASPSTTTSTTHDDRLIQDQELSWQEQLFRRQFADLPISAHLAHLDNHLDRVHALYVAYFHFRTRGFVLHEGLKLGVDYVAYPPGGAEKWHAQFAIIVGDVEPLAGPSTATREDPADDTFQRALRTMQICVKQKKTFLYVRVFSSALPLSPSSSSPLPPTSSAPSSAVSSPTTSVRARDELRSFSVDVRHLSNWFIAKGRQRETNQKGADTAHSRKHGLQQPQPQSQKKKQKTQGETAPMTDASQAQATAEATSAV